MQRGQGPGPCFGLSIPTQKVVIQVIFFPEDFKNIFLCIVVQLHYYVNLFPLQLVKVSGSRGALVGLQLEVVGDKEDGGGGDKRDNVRGEEAVVEQIFVVVVFLLLLLLVLLLLLQLFLLYLEEVVERGLDLAHR